MKALELSRRYFDQVARPKLMDDFPALYGRMAAGLVGNGSECFGYDDEISRDHDWGVDFFLWLPEDCRGDIPALTRWKDDLFRNHPPPHPRTPSEYGARVGVMTAGDFFRSLIGYPEGPGDIASWRRVPEDNLAMAVNGAVFLDNDGGFTATRERLLGYYPEDLRKKKLAARCMALAQTGQYNLARCHRRGDRVTYRTVLARFNDSAISAVFLLNRVFKPYYKWAYRAMTELPILADAVGPLLEALAASRSDWPDAYRQDSRSVEELCALIAGELRRQGLAASEDTFLTAQGEEIQRSIADGALRSLPAQYE